MCTLATIPVGLQALRWRAAATTLTNCSNHLLLFLSAQKIALSGAQCELQSRFKQAWLWGIWEQPCRREKADHCECHDCGLHQTLERRLVQGGTGWVCQGTKKTGIIHSAEGGSQCHWGDSILHVPRVQKQHSPSGMCGKLQRQEQEVMLPGEWGAVLTAVWRTA